MLLELLYIMLNIKIYPHLSLFQVNPFLLYLIDIYLRQSGFSCHNTVQLQQCNYKISFLFYLHSNCWNSCM